MQPAGWLRVNGDFREVASGSLPGIRLPRTPGSTAETESGAVQLDCEQPLVDRLAQPIDHPGSVEVDPRGLVVLDRVEARPLRKHAPGIGAEVCRRMASNSG